MILPGSYANGFAPRDGQPLYPELWRGCVGAWAPCLGPTGLTLRDWSGFGNHGTLTNMDPGTDWVASQGRYSLDFDGTNDFVRSSQCIKSGNFSWSSWVRFRSFASTRTILSQGTLAAGTYITLRVNASAQLFFSVDGVATTVTAAGTLVVNRWYSVVFTHVAGNSSLFLDGSIVATQSKAADYTSDNFTIGSTPASGGAFFLDGLTDACAVHNRALSPYEVRLLAMRPGIAYDLAPRRRSRIFTDGFKAYWAARKAQIIGGGL